jgi:glycoprotein-N-acetylgalactosamine 3-beta-galactosyltransferase
MTLEQKEFLQQIPIAPIHNMKSGYDHLTQKSILAFLFVYKNYFNDFDWFVKTDDDTYLIIENLKEFLRKQDTSQPITFGYNFRVIIFLSIFNSLYKLF